MVDQQLVEIFVDAVNAAADGILRSKREIFSVDQEKGKGYTARPDLISHTILDARLGKHAPIYSEESRRRIDPRGQRVLTVLDECDGTTNCVHLTPEWSIPASFHRDGQVQFALISVPELHELYLATDAAYLNGKKIRVADVTSLQHAIVACEGNWSDEKIRPLLGLLEGAFRPPVCFRRRMIESTALALARVASGRWHVVYHPTSEPWDHTAGAHHVLKAGGVVANFDGSDWDPFTPGILAACTHELHEQASQIVRSVVSH